MKKVRKNIEPAGLTSFHNEATHDRSFEAFSSHRQGDAKRELREQLAGDQAGLCAYCEIAFVPLDSAPVIEHFHPRSVSTCGSVRREWDIDWDNLLGVCSGGGGKNDARCDRLKGGHHLCGVIHNPLVLSIGPWYSVDLQTGLVEPGPDCPPHERDRVRVTVNQLGLNGELSDARRALIDDLLDDLDRRTTELARRNHPEPEKQARRDVARLEFADSTRWPQFFTTIRSTLRQEAEERLHSLSFSG